VGAAVGRRAALLGSRAALATLRARVARDGREVVLELVAGSAGDGADGRKSPLAALRTRDGKGIDELVILTATDAFASVEELLAALQFLDAEGLGFESMREPWLALRSAAAPAGVTGGSAGIGGLTAALESRAAQFLDLSIERLEADNRAGAEQQRKAAIQADVGKVVAQLFVLGPYAVAVGIVSQAVLNAALLDPDLLLRRLRDLVSGSNAVSGAVTGAIPDALKGIVFSAISSLVLLVFRGTSIGLRAELGGVLFMGIVTLSIYGLSAGFGTGTIGSLVALPGLVLAVVVTLEFTHLVLRITSSPGRPAAPRPAAGDGFFARLRQRLGDLGQTIDPARKPALAAAFVAVPVLTVLLFLGAAATNADNGGWLFWPARVSLYALALWSAWACLATPGAVRIPLWSMLGWAAVLLLLSAATAVTAVFAVVVVLLLAGSVFELVFRHVGEVDA
jgi:hypothetical protein